MEKKIKIVIGSNFGDEGKGLMTDYFCHNLSKDGPVVNVRYNGGAQAGHTVVIPDGKRHVFSHFGSGSFNSNVATFLSDKFILNPMLFCRELDELKSKFNITPKVYISPMCRITTPYDMLINQIVEIDRGGNRHGSCGLGIYETVERNKNSAFWLNVGCMQKGNISMDTFLRLLQHRYVPERLDIYGVRDCSGGDLPYIKYPEFCNLILSDQIIENYVHDYKKMMEHCEIVSYIDIYKNYERIVFEGAQGLLLDEGDIRYYPHVTASSTGSRYPFFEIKEAGIKTDDIEVCYVTRPYLTRHGAGPLETECFKEDIIGEKFFDKTNLKNEFQGELRYGFFDVSLFRRSIFCDERFGPINYKKRSIAITHLDETNGEFVIGKGITSDIENPLYGLTNKIYRSFGETREDIC